jgi:carbon-monoxide dehydrogenase catalytic subunit
MSDKDIKDSFENSAERMRGDNKTLGSALTREDTNDPNFHEDIHQRVLVDYGKIQKSPSMEEVHAWQREHIKKDDQSKDGYPLNVIIDPAMREMYQVVHDA